MQTARRAEHGYNFQRGGDFPKKVTITRVYEINTPSLLSLDKIEPNCAVVVVNEKEAYYIVQFILPQCFWVGMACPPRRHPC